MRRTLFTLAAALTVAGCMDDVVEPTTQPKLQYDHTYDAADADINVNNYTVSVHGAAMESHYKGQTGLFNGNFAYGTSATQVFHVNTANGATDFATGGLPVEVAANSHGAALYTSSLFVEKPSQALGPKTSLGLTTVRETYSYSTAGDDDYIILRYSITNTTSSTITGLNVGILADPDFVRAGNNQAFFDPTTQSALVTVGGTPAVTARHAIVPIGTAVGGFYTWANGGDPSTNAAWWNVIGGGLRNVTSSGDVREYIGSAPLTILAGETRTFTYALVAGDNAADLITNITAARNKAATITGSRPFVTVVASLHAGTVLYSGSVTFANFSDAAAFNANDAVCGGAALKSAYVTGNRVDFTFGALDLDDELRTGDTVLCTGRLNNGKYFIGGDTPSIARDVNTLTKLTTWTGLDRTPTWSPDGLSIAFASTRDGGGIYVMDASGDLTSIRRVTNNNADIQPDWSPDGNWIIFSRGGAIMKIAANATTATAPTQLTQFASISPNSKSDSDPRFSPDGQTIAFRRTLVFGNVASTHIWKMTAAGELAPGTSVATILASGGASDLQPEWSLDGTKLYFSSTRGGQGGIYVMDVAVGEPSVQLVTQPEPTGWGFPALSPDGKTIAALSDGKLVLHDMASGQHQVLIYDPRSLVMDGATNAQNLEWNPNGSRFLLEAGADIWITSPTDAVTTPGERAQMLTESVNTLVQDGLISAGDGAQLIQKLDNIAAKVLSGQNEAALNSVNAFINKVNALVNSRRINVVTGEQMTADANALIDQLNAL